MSWQQVGGFVFLTGLFCDLGGVSSPTWESGFEFTQYSFLPDLKGQLLASPSGSLMAEALTYHSKLFVDDDPK
jgi:hypothetical protein